MSNMKLDDRTLDELSQIIKKFCQKQTEIIKEYRRGIKSLEERWDSDKFEELVDYVDDITDCTEKSSSAVAQRYPTYYSKKADMIRNRPAFSGGIAGTTNSLSQSSSSRSSSGSKSYFDKVFDKFNKDFKTNIYMYLRKINFYVPNEKISFYDPDGITKRGLYKNIMALDVNSNSFEQDLLSLTGQHVYFQIQHFQRMEIIRNLGNELNAAAWKDDIAFKDLTKQIVEGKGINHKYLNFPDNNTKYAFNFFTQAFTATLANDTQLIEKYNKYYSNSYGQFCTILNNLNY